jgi:hypothetical protein
MTTRVYLETGTTWTFACALDWPGWCRRGKGDGAALEALLAYADRYAAVVGEAPDPRLTVLGSVKGNATTEFGAPGVVSEWERPLKATDLPRLQACWHAFDAVVAGAPAALQKGPRGGGRDRDQIVEHVREAERAYGRQVGVKVPPRTPWPEQREQLLEGLRAGAETKWPPSYAVRRIAWHVLDHAWEIEDKSS